MQTSSDGATSTGNSGEAYCFKLTQQLHGQGEGALRDVVQVERSSWARKFESSMLESALVNEVNNAINARIGALLRRALRQCAYRLSAALDISGLTISQAEALASLVQFQAPVEQHLLANAIGLDRSTVSQLIIGLIDRDLIEPIIGRDRRRKLLRATISGTSAGQAAMIALDEGNRRFAEDVGPQSQQLMNLLKLIALRPSPAPVFSLPQHPSPFLTDFHFLLRRAGQVAVAMFSDETREFATRPLEVTILLLLTRGRTFSISEVQDITGSERSVVTPSVRRLADRGLVRREQNPSDRRGILVTLTDAGRQHFDDLQAPIAHYELRFLAPLDDAQKSELRTLLNAISTTPR